ncbi:polyprenyl synthetase family protein [Leifsonia sp. NPDC080035]|uniref:Polyprenyl synthetase family protein n=1 Tax=Leifsonia sp. NPDC080035 TaxID=3143936 RepID=A0AAU7GDX7_9MICO
MTQLHPMAPPEAHDSHVVALAASALAEVDERLNAFFAARAPEAAAHGDAYRRLWESAWDATRGGKRLRPRFTLTAFHGLGGAQRASAARESAVRVAVAFELLHTAFLLHDDVIDGDTVRRGRPNVAGEFTADALFRGAGLPRARLWGESAAILAGDLLLHAATAEVARIDAPASVRDRLMDVLERAVSVTAAGELADVGLSTGMSGAGIAEVLAMTERKTAEYSVSGPLVAGVLLAGAADREGDLLDVLAEYGRLVGVAFQLGDDLLGVFGSEAVTGKSVVSDLRQGKQTTLVAFARGTASWPVIADGFGRPDLGRAEAAGIASALEECGARGFVERLLHEHVDAAIHALDSPAVPAALAAELTVVARSCVGRIA